MGEGGWWWEGGFAGGWLGGGRGYASFLGEGGGEVGG